MADLLDIYLNQEATWKTVSSTDEYSQPTFVVSAIKVRWEKVRRLVRNKQGDEVVSESRVYCKEAVKVGDVLTYDGTDFTIITVNSAVDLNGRVQWYEVAL